MADTHEIHVISNTHWDREWLCNFQETRLMLVEFFDRLLDILDTEPGYNSYLLDSQAVPVEDYLELRPEKRATIEKHVREKRLFIGPWYTCPEGFCVNGESLVRNLLMGHRVARQLGGVMKVGHTPFSYGQNSQLPQIYAGFGIDTILFYHGVSHDDTPNEFVFEGADGTQALGSQMSSGARYNFYHNIYRRVLYGSRIDDREYSWTHGGLPFHRAGEAHCMEHHLLLDPVTDYHAELIEEAVKALRDAEVGCETTRYLAFMDGHDSSVADRVTLRIIEDAKRYLGGDVIFHSNLPDLMAKVKAAAKDLVVLKGERRIPKDMGGRIHLYSDVLSGRARMKRANAQAEQLLQRVAEPFATLAWALGREYPATALELAWKTLLKGHAHDSIAGAGVDDIERDMLYRIRQVNNIADGLTARSLQHIQTRIDNSDAGPKDVLLTVFNPSPYPRTEVVTAIVDLPNDASYDAFSIVEAGSTQPVPMQVLTRRPTWSVVNHAGDATAAMYCDRVTLHFEAREVPALGYATYHLTREGQMLSPGLVSGHNAMQNEHLRVAIETDGTLTITHRATGREFRGVHYFEDGGEAGHAWMHIEPARDSVLTSRACPTVVSLEENGPLLARYRVVVTMKVPVGLDENGGDRNKRLDGVANSSRRTAETRDMVITSSITLRKGARAVDVTTRFDNPCKNHRLRAMFPSAIPAETVAVESAFDVVDREIVHGPGSPWFGSHNPTFPMHRFVDVSDGKMGIAVINDGLREYEVTQDADRAIAITLMRAYEVNLTTVSKRWEQHPEMELSQCLGAHELRYAIYPHAGTWDQAEVYREAERLTVALEPAQVGAHGGDLPKRKSFLAIEPANLILSAAKQSEDGSGIVLRVFNPTAAPLSGKITVGGDVASARLATMEEVPGETLPVSAGTIALTVAPKRIVTVRVEVG